MNVQVISPDGVSHPVKITPHTTVRQILEEICKKTGSALNTFNLRYQGRLLDNGCRLHYAGLNEGTVFEMGEFVEPNAGPICISFEVNCLRFIGFFKPEDSILNVVMTLCPEDILNKENAVPAISCLQYKVVGLQKLQETNLKLLGILDGNVVMRMEMRDLGAIPRTSKPTSKGSKPIQRNVNQQNIKGLARERNVSPQSDEPKPKEANIGPSTSSAVPADFHYLGERCSMLFTMPENYSSLNDPSDEFFDLQVDEAKKVMRDLQSQRQELENQPLITQTMRQQMLNEHIEKKLSFYKKTVIRVLFPNQIILQGAFESNECVQKVYEFVKSHLQHPDLPFYLYTTPPKLVLDQGKRLVDVDCVPMASIYFGLKDKQLKIQEFIKSELMSSLTTYEVATAAAVTIRNSGMDLDAIRANIREKAARTARISTQNHTRSIQPPEPAAPQEQAQIKKTAKDQIPKWFKPL